MADCWEEGSVKEGQALMWWKPKKESKEKDLAKQTEVVDFAFMANDMVLISILASDWLTDSATTTHIIRSKSDFIGYLEVTSEIEGLTLGATLGTKGIRTVALEFKVNNKIYSITLKDVKHGPEAPNNILSIRHLVEKGHSVVFAGTRVEFKSKNGCIFGTGWKVGWMYQMRVQTCFGTRQDCGVRDKHYNLSDHEVLAKLREYQTLLQHNSRINLIFVPWSQPN